MFLLVCDGRKGHRGDHRAHWCDDCELLLNITSRSSPPFLIDLQLNGKNLIMELDTGADMSLIYQSTYDKLDLKPSGSEN